MIQNKYGQCSECKSEGVYGSFLIVNRKHMLCEKHNDIRLGLQSGKKPGEWKNRRYNTNFEYCTRWGFIKEMDMFLWIWQNRPHISFFTGQPITSIHPWNFVHVLPKGLKDFPHYRLNPDNVVLGTKEEHDLFDVGTEAKRLEYKKKHPNYDFPAFLAYRDKLKAEYRKEFDL